jgi:hypothetical protein
VGVCVAFKIYSAYTTEETEAEPLV